ncbi:MAG: hypothetical protein ACRCVT_04885, partial [Leadbetterella sp.]
MKGWKGLLGIVFLVFIGRNGYSSDYSTIIKKDTIPQNANVVSPYSTQKVTSSTSTGSTYQEVVKSPWKVDSSRNVFATDESQRVWRSGSVAISDNYISSFSNKLMVTNSYKDNYSRIAYFGMNDSPKSLYRKDSATVDLERDTTAAHTGLIVNHFTNF